jgi:hypothetical protein
MQAVLKGLHSIDVNLETFTPEDHENFGLVITAMVGPLSKEGADSFDITVCTPKWLIKECEVSGALLGLHKLIVPKYDYRHVRQFIEKFLMRCSGETWREVAGKVSLLGQWEFEGSAKG